MRQYKLIIITIPNRIQFRVYAINQHSGNIDHTAITITSHITRINIDRVRQCYTT